MDQINAMLSTITKSIVVCNYVPSADLLLATFELVLS